MVLSSVIVSKSCMLGNLLPEVGLVTAKFKLNEPQAHPSADHPDLHPGRFPRIIGSPPSEWAIKSGLTTTSQQPRQRSQ
jgi:hypothetical protein